MTLLGGLVMLEGRLRLLARWCNGLGATSSAAGVQAGGGGLPGSHVRVATPACGLAGGVATLASFRSHGSSSLVTLVFDGSGSRIAAILSITVAKSLLGVANP